LIAGREPNSQEREAALLFLTASSLHQQELPPREFALAMFNLNAFLYVE
jgi:hypothetical protein